MNHLTGKDLFYSYDTHGVWGVLSSIEQEKWHKLSLYIEKHYDRESLLQAEIEENSFEAGFDEGYNEGHIEGYSEGKYDFSKCDCGENLICPKCDVEHPILEE